MIKLSIIIPVYNIQNYIGDCIDSILPQLTDETELIIIDDGSTDESAKVIFNYLPHPQIQYHHQENKKQGAARNIGVKLAKGKYIWFVDGDDMITKNAIKNVFIYEKTHLVGHDMLMFELSRLNENGLIEKKMNLKNLTNENSKNFIRKNNTYSISPCNKIINKEFLLKNNLFFKENIFFEDNHFFIRFYNEAIILSSLNLIFYIRREREGSTLRSDFTKFKLDSQFETIKEINKIKPKQLSQQFLDNKLFWYTHTYIKKCYLFNEDIRNKNIMKCFKEVPRFRIYLKDSFGVIRMKLSYNYNKSYFLKKINRPI